MIFIIGMMGLGLVAIILAIFLYRSNHRARALATNLQAMQVELKQAQTKQESLHQELSGLQNKFQVATEDSITNLLGWPLFEDRLNQAIKESVRYQFTMGLLLIDIDDFKVINDALGHEVGNGLLREVARRLETCIRQVDSITRFGKDTFVILLTQLAKPETAAIVAQRMLQILGQAMQFNQQEIYITASIGIAIFPADGQDAASLLRNADDALHLTKQKSKHSYQFYQEKINLDSQRELAIVNSLRREMLYREFTLQYQPIMNVNNKKLFCMDAILRWQHPELGVINLHELWYFAERQRKLNAITEWMLEKACKQFMHWRNTEHQAEMVALPLSLKQLENSQFIYRISQILQELKFKPEWLLLQLKDSSAKVEFDVLEKAFNMLKYLGVKLAIDNFGAEAFSFRQFKNFTVNYVKLDESLIEHIENDARSEALVKSLVLLAHNLSQELIVPGVNTGAQLSMLKNMGCELMEGSFIAAPIAAKLAQS